MRERWEFVYSDALHYYWRQPGTGWICMRPKVCFWNHTHIKWLCKEL